MHLVTLGNHRLTMALETVPPGGRTLTITRNTSDMGNLASRPGIRLARRPVRKSRGARTKRGTRARRVPKRSRPPSRPVGVKPN